MTSRKRPSKSRACGGTHAPRIPDELTAMAAHDLRAPLTVINAFLDLLAAGLPQEQLDRALRVARRSVRRMDEMLDDLLHAARAEAGGLPEPASEARLVTIAEDVLAEMRVAHPDVRFDLVAEDDPVVVARGTGLARVLTNLLSNAVEHCPPAEPVLLSVSCRNGRATLSVEDAGPGLPAEARKRVLERFQCQERGRVGGHGLGLYIVRSIVGAHGGSVELGESPRGGTRVTVELPPAEPRQTEKAS